MNSAAVFNDFALADAPQALNMPGLQFLCSFQAQE
jgi:hypothetical protein